MSRGDQDKKDVLVLNVERHEGLGVSVGKDVELRDAIAALRRRVEEEEILTSMHAAIDALPYDGAIALQKALAQMFGFTVSRRGMRLVNVQVDPDGTTVTTPWGRFEVPGIDEGYFEADYTREDGRIIFQVSAHIPGKYRDTFDAVVTLTREFLERESIYKGRALSIKFTDEDGDPLGLPTIEFMDVSTAVRPIFTRELEERLAAEVYAYVELPAHLILSVTGKLKRGILLAGEYGTGKTMLAGHLARQALDNGFTFVYVKPEDIPYGIEFAKMYGPALLFSEDVESVAGRRRTADVNELLLKLDGVDNKAQRLVSVFTTNHHGDLNEAFLRPGRIDVALHIQPPDAEAALRLMQAYGGQMLDSDDDFGEASRLLAGMIPASIAEVVMRAKLRALLRAGSADDLRINNTDMVGAAKSLNAERQFLAAPHQPDPHPMTVLGNAFGDSLGTAMSQVLNGHLPTSPNGAGKLEDFVN